MLLPPKPSISLRRALLTGFLLLGLLPSAALCWLGYVRAREALTSQISASLQGEAQGLQTAIDAQLFERLENLRVWSRSELMQDLAFGDVDHRVAHYLADLHQGYGDVYLGLDCRDAAGRLLADARGPAWPPRQAPVAPVAATQWLAAGQVRLDLPASPQMEGRPPLSLETALPPDTAGPAAERAGLRLHLDVNPHQLDRLLDAAAVEGRQIVVIDAAGRWVAASRGLRARPLGGTAEQARSRQLVSAGGAGPVEAWAGLPARLLIGRAHAGLLGTQPGTGWTTLVLQPVDTALAPVQRMGWIFAGLLLGVLLLTWGVASWLSAAMAGPIARLTWLTGRYRQGLALPPGPAPQDTGITELDQLGRAWDEMLAAVDRSRAELVRSSKMNLLGEMAAVLAHEVRTPLGILRASAQVLKREPGLRPEALELMGFIESETQRLNSLVSTMLDTARPRKPSLSRCDVHALLTRCAQMQDLRAGEAGDSRRVQLDLDARAPQLALDAEQLVQVVFNLLQNAAQACGPAGRIALATRDSAEGLTISCADDGPGIPPALAGRLFEPFVSGRAGGIGLGLAVVQQFAQAHGGHVEAGRSAWGGALLQLWLPREPAGPGPAAAPSASGDNAA